MKLRLWILAGIFSISVLGSASATTWFVRSGASGNGTSWANAWASPGSIVWSSLNAGDTVCMAGGTYSGGSKAITFGKSGAAGNPIVLKRATASDATCGSGTTGWDASYDSQVLLTGGAYIDTQSISNVTLDGMVWDGIRVDVQNQTNWTAIGNFGANATSNITLRNIEAAGPCLSAPCAANFQQGATAIQVYGSHGVQSNWLLQNLDLHGACTVALFLNADGLVMEHSRLADSSGGSVLPQNVCHSNIVQANGYGTSQVVTFRYNEVSTWEAEGIMFQGAVTYYVYGNIWHDTVGYGRVFDPQGFSGIVVHFYNNTIINDEFGCFTGSGTLSGDAYNNLYFGNSFPTCGLPFGESYAASDGNAGTNGQSNITSSIFVNYAAGTVAGYHLSGHTNAGYNLGSSYNTDYDGDTRTNWDRGFDEYTGAPATLTISTTSLPGGTVGTAYSATLVATGGTLPYSWDCNGTTCSTVLPPGLSLNSSTGAITGTPTTAGTYNFTARVTDNVSGTDTQPLTIVISAASSANWYVRPSGGGGGGTSWTDAWNGLNGIVWASVSCGNTIWIAGGTYTTALVPNKACTSGSPLYIRRARSDDSNATGAAGWNSSYDSTVHQTGMDGITWSNASTYVTISGRTTAAGGANGWWIDESATTEGYGISFPATNANNNTMEYMDIQGPGEINYTLNSHNGGRAINCVGSVSGETFSHMKLWRFVAGAYAVGCNSPIFDHIEMYDMMAANWAQDTRLHPDGIYVQGATNGIIRYNLHHKGPDGNGTGAGIIFEQSGGASGWQVYGNIFYNLDQNGMQALNILSTNANTRIWNNTIFNSILQYTSSCGSGSYYQNNLFYLSTDINGNPFTGSCGTTSNNVTASTAAVFVNAAPNGSSNFHIVSTIGAGYPRNAGTNLSTYFTTDMDGNTYGADGTWDAGAYEYSSGTTPTAPSNVRISVN